VFLALGARSTRLSQRLEPEPEMPVVPVSENSTDEYSTGDAARNLVQTNCSCRTKPATAYKIQKDWANDTGD